MKRIFSISILTVLTAAMTLVVAQDWPEEYLGLPGDNLNLYAVMNLFQESETLEGFERNLNDENSRINNLDLNGDNMIDYITVSDYVDRKVHTIVLRAQLNMNEQQDVAVFTVEKIRNGSVQIQLIGDEALYGRNYIIEPIYAETANPGYTGSTRYYRNENVVTTTYYDIAEWPMIRFIYRPNYVVWNSSWYWGYYPTYWRPWTPHYWHYYYGYHSHWHNHYYKHYRHWDHYRCDTYQTFYYSKVRTYSPKVYVNVNNGHYRNTYSRPDQRKAGEELYTRTYNPRNTQTAYRSSATKTDRRSTSTRTANERSTMNKTTTAVRPTTQSRSSTPAVQRSSSSRNSTPAVQRNSSTRSSTPAVQRSTSIRNSTPAVQRSTSSRNSAPAVKRSSSSKSSRSSTPAVQRSTSSRNSAPAVKKSSSSRNSTPAVQRNSSTRSSKPAVQRSSSRSSTPAVQRSSSSRSSKPEVKKSPERSAPANSKSSRR